MELTIKDIVNEPAGRQPSGDFLPDRWHSMQDYARLLADLRRADALLVGGGDLILGYASHYLLLRAARYFGVPVYHVGVGVNLRGSGRLARSWQLAELPRCAHFWVRDSVSAERLRELNVAGQKITLVPDLVFSLDSGKLLAEAQAEPTHPQFAAQLPGGKYLAVSVRDPEGNSARWGDANYRQLAAALDELADRHGIAIVFVPFLSAARDAARRFTPCTTHDEQVADRVLAMMRRRDMGCILRGDFDYRQALWAISRAELTIGTRLHSLIFSTLVGTPFVALSYNLKTESYMADLGLKEYALPIDRFDAAELVAAVSRALRQAGELRGLLLETICARGDKASQYAQLTGMLRARTGRPKRLSSARAWLAWLLWRASIR